MTPLIWRDAEDQYKPKEKNIYEYIQEKRKNNCSINDNLKITQMMLFVYPEAEQKLKEHLEKDPYNETGGVLVGDAYYCTKSNTTYTEIVGSIPALHTVGNRVHFQFTPECWTSILNEQKKHFSEKTIVGWYHSHPGHGIFLSGTDLNTQRVCFKEIWHIALVYDPLQKTIGYFYGSQGQRIEPTVLENSCNQLNWEPAQQTQKKIELFPASKKENEISYRNRQNKIDNENNDDEHPTYEREFSHQQSKSNNKIFLFWLLPLLLIGISIILILILYPKKNSSNPSVDKPPESMKNFQYSPYRSSPVPPAKKQQPE